MEKDILLDDQHLDIIHLNKQGYCCSQIMAIMLLKALGRDNTPLVRAIGGLCYGLGHSGEICGVLSGGACLIALCAGKGSDIESSREDLPLMISELVEWFKQRTGPDYGGITCDDILLVSPDKRACIILVSETYKKVLSILASHGIHPVQTPHG